MYPSRFGYEAPKSVEEAVALLDASGGEAKILAGGQSLVPMLKLRFAAPAMLVDINSIPGLDYHRIESDGSLHIGALCRHEDLEFSDILAQSFPTLAAAASLVVKGIVSVRTVFPFTSWRCLMV